MPKTIRLNFITALLLVCFGANRAAGTSDTYSNPVIAGDYPDPSVIRVGDDYWATVTSGDWAPHFPILHSRDLINWRAVGAVFQKRPRWAARNFWAPEIQEDRGRFFVYYTARRKGGPLCVAVATASEPSGPYTDHGPLVCQDIGSIDAFFIRDENKQPYLIWKEDGNDRNQPTPIWAQRLTESGTKLIGERTEILRNTAAWEKHVVEGSFIIRRGGWFYHFYSGNACCGRECNYALGVARARKLLGPWEKNPGNPILAANEYWRCPGHGSIVTAPDGRDFLLYHSYRRRPDTFNVGREALLDEVEWNAGNWPEINNGKGPSITARAPSSFLARATGEGFFDEFDDFRLDASWQWPLADGQTARIESGRGGRLVLSPAADVKDDEYTDTVLGQRTISGDYTATALIDVRAMTPGTRAGLGVYSWRSGALGAAIGGGRIHVWRREDKKQELVATAKVSEADSIHLRMTVAGGKFYQFAFGVDGHNWRDVGGRVEGNYIEGARVALTVGGARSAAAKFEWMRIMPSVAVPKP
ncbi:MAG TPA: family 43 glycosylhydrolase [Pyrinomonadaceae bacterium]|jgi:beta-xylosidase|nr:family 43 glycosylhydrolase [Pyrinomonadaceae bacterium]